MTKEQVAFLLQKLLNKLTEQGSLSAYTTALVATNIPGIPVWAQYSLYAFATLKFVLEG